jgi:hypothetical protein
MSAASKVLRQYAELARRGARSGLWTEADAEEQIASFAKELGVSLEDSPQKYSRIVGELETAGATIESGPDGASYIRPGSADRTKLSADAAALYDRLSASAPGVGNVSATDREIALHVATFGDGMSEQEALRELAFRGDEFVAERREKIDAHRRRLEKDAHDAERRAFEASPEGRKIAAAEAAQTEARERELEEHGRILLTREATSYGLKPEHVEQMSRAEVLRVSGIAPNARDERAAADRNVETNIERANAQRPNTEGGTNE